MWGQEIECPYKGVDPDPDGDRLISLKQIFQPLFGQANTDHSLKFY